MKGFIEVTLYNRKKLSILISSIYCFSDDSVCISVGGKMAAIEVKENHEEIKELIKKSNVDKDKVRFLEKSIEDYSRISGLMAEVSNCDSNYLEYEKMVGEFKELLKKAQEND